MIQSFIQPIISLLIGFVGGAGALWLQQRFAWKPQKRIELRNKVFDDAMQALAMYEVDACDAALQENWKTYSGQGLRPHVVLRIETRILMQRSLLQVKAFFSPETSEAFDAALRADVSLTNIPNSDFAQKSDKAIRLMAKDLGVL